MSTFGKSAIHRILRSDRRRLYLPGRQYLDLRFGKVSEYDQQLADLSKASDLRSLMLVTSELSLAEIMIKPIKMADVFEQETYKRAITSTDNLTVVPVNSSILIQAAETRANTKLKLPDAIHAATAIATNCTTFLTNDGSLEP